MSGCMGMGGVSSISTEVDSQSHTHTLTHARTTTQQHNTTPHHNITSQHHHTAQHHNITSQHHITTQHHKHNIIKSATQLNITSQHRNKMHTYIRVQSLSHKHFSSSFLLRYYKMDSAKSGQTNHNDGHRDSRVRGTKKWGGPRRKSGVSTRHLDGIAREDKQVID